MADAAPEHGIHPRRGRRRAEEQGELGGGVGAVEGAEVDDPARGRSAYPGEPRGVVVGGPGVVQPPGADEGDAGAPRHQVLDERQGALVGPVQVVQGEAEASWGGDAVQDRPEGGEEALPGEVVGGRWRTSRRRRSRGAGAARVGATYDGQRASALSTSRPSSTSRRARRRSMTGISAACRDRGRQRADGDDRVGAGRQPPSTRVVLPMPASPVTRRSPVPDSRWRRTAVSSGLRPAMRGVGGRASSWGVVAVSQRSWKAVVSPSMASTRSSRVPQVGILGEEKAWETVVWETPVSRARVRREGQPARWWRSWRASTRSRWGPGGRSGRGSALMGGPPGWSRSRGGGGRARARRRRRARGARERRWRPPAAGRAGRRASGSTPRRAGG